MNKHATIHHKNVMKPFNTLLAVNDIGYCNEIELPYYLLSALAHKNFPICPHVTFLGFVLLSEQTLSIFLQSFQTNALVTQIQYVFKEINAKL